KFLFRNSGIKISLSDLIILSFSKLIIPYNLVNSISFRQTDAQRLGAWRGWGLLKPSIFCRNEDMINNANSTKTPISPNGCW
ncbi:hypothetical protein MW871_16255, partial [Flavobacterium sp. I-SCBP12n]